MLLSYSLIFNILLSHFIPATITGQALSPSETMLSENDTDNLLSVSTVAMTASQKRSRANQESLDTNLASIAAKGKKNKIVTGGKPIPRSMDTVAHMDEMRAYSRGMLQTVTNSIGSLADSLSRANHTSTDTDSPFSKSAKSVNHYTKC
jgi:uridylate kinase